MSISDFYIRVSFAIDIDHFSYGIFSIVRLEMYICNLAMLSLLATNDVFLK